MKIIAHRCGTGLFPEQTIAAAAHSLQLGVDYVEMDIRFTSDGIPVICHDSNALRIFGVDKNISDMTLADFLALRHVNDRRYPSHTLDDVLSCNIQPILLHCKISGSHLHELLTHLLLYDYENKVVIGVQHPEDVSTIKMSHPSVKTLAFMQNPEDYNAYMHNGVDVIRLWEQWLTIDAIENIHSAGREVWVMANTPSLGGVGFTTEENLHSWVGMGVDGVLINNVEWAMKIVVSI